MAVHTTAADYAAFAGDTDGDPSRASIYLAEAERFVARQAGQDFYDADATTSDASQDWVRAVVRTVAVWRQAEQAAVARLAALSASSDASGVKSQTLTNRGTTETITYRDPAVTAAVGAVDPLRADPRIAEIIAAYAVSAQAPVGFLFGVAGRGSYGRRR